MAISTGVKIFLGFRPDEDDEVVRKEWDKRTKNVCKPCWELKYCPYGVLVEDFPLFPITKAEAIEHQERLKEELAKGTYDEKEHEIIEEKIRSYTPDDYPEQLSQDEIDMTCKVFGHLCPVFFVNEPFTETEEMRRIGRYIPAKMKMRVARRDNYTCQMCGKNLKDDDIEFDHMIPISKGGSSEEHNIRAICSECNRMKSDGIDI